MGLRITYFLILVYNFISLKKILALLIKIKKKEKSLS